MSVVNTSKLYSSSAESEVGTTSLLLGPTALLCIIDKMTPGQYKWTGEDDVIVSKRQPHHLSWSGHTLQQCQPRPEAAKPNKSLISQVAQQLWRDVPACSSLILQPRCVHVISSCCKDLINSCLEYIYNSLDNRLDWIYQHV